MTMPARLYRRRIAALVIELARDDPLLVKEMIARLRLSGDTETDDLAYLDRIADRWAGINEEIRRQAASMHPHELRG